MISKRQLQETWNRLRQPFAFWQLSLLPGLTLTGLIVLARLLGVFQGAELQTLDLFLRWRPPEPVDERILIVGIDEVDIQKTGSYPIPDGTLAALLRKLDQYQPRAVGLDIYRDLPVEPGHEALITALEELPYVFGVEFLASNNPRTLIPDGAVSPPPSLPEDRVGFVNFALDPDGMIRRSPLGSESPDDSDGYRFALTTRLAKTYLSHEQITLENGRRDPIAMRFGSVELPRFRPHSGGYVRSDDGGLLTLLNVRNNPEAFHRVSMADVMTGNVDPDWIRERVVLIGITAVSAQDLLPSRAIPGRNPGEIYGIELHAHAVSQILSAVLDQRPLLQVWSEIGEYLWIIGWSVLGIVLVGLKLGPMRYFLLVIGVGLSLILVSYGVLLMGWWLPIVPPLTAFGLNGLVLQGLFLFYDRMAQLRIEEGQRAIKQAYNAIHNGPLQTLALMVQNSDQEPNGSQLALKLRQLDEDIRDVFDALEQEIKPNANQLHLSGGGPILELSDSLRDLLNEVFIHTIDRPLQHFTTLQLKVNDFKPMQDWGLTLEEKRDLCRFLEEALCNVGKHAEGATRLKVACFSEAQENIIAVEDNGRVFQKQPATLPKLPVGGGTQQAQQLARQLGGQYIRHPVSPQGMHCELRWPIYLKR